MSQSDSVCPVCHAPVTSWSSRCARCHYHPDGKDHYNRAQDDVALIFHTGFASRRHQPRAAGWASPSRWLHLLTTRVAGGREQGASRSA
jgi:hypothetical protein